MNIATPQFHNIEKCTTFYRVRPLQKKLHGLTWTSPGYGMAVFGMQANGGEEWIGIEHFPNDWRNLRINRVPFYRHY